MKKPKEFEVETLKDFQELVESKHFSIAKAIVESILNNVKTRKKNIHVLTLFNIDSTIALAILKCLLSTNS